MMKEVAKKVAENSSGQPDVDAFEFQLVKCLITKRIL